MDEIDALELFLTEIEEDLGYTANTKFGLQDHDPEMVVIDSWNSERNLRTTGTFDSFEYDDDGVAIGENHHWYYIMNVELHIKSENELTAMERQKAIKEHFRRYEGNPLDFHEDTVLFKVGDGGLREPMFEPTSLRVYTVAQNFNFEFIDTEVLAEDVEAIEEIEIDLEIE